jgi:hypothetical protein
MLSQSTIWIFKVVMRVAYTCGYSRIAWDEKEGKFVESRSWIQISRWALNSLHFFLVQVFYVVGLVRKIILLGEEGRSWRDEAENMATHVIFIVGIGSFCLAHLSFMMNLGTLIHYLNQLISVNELLAGELTFGHQCSKRSIANLPFCLKFRGLYA